MDRIGAAPQSRTAWRALVDDGQEVRGQGVSGGKVEVYTNKRGILGRVFAFIKDPLFATARAEQRKLGQKALSDFLGKESGLSPIAVHKAFERAGISENTPLTKGVIERAFAEVDVEKAQQAKLDAMLKAKIDAPPDLSKLRLNQTVSVSQLPRPMQDEMMRDTNGRMNARALEALITSGQLNLGIDPGDPNLKVKALPISGANTHGLFQINSSKGSFIVKESGGPFLLETDHHPEIYLDGGYEFDNTTGAWRNNDVKEPEKLRIVANSRLGTTEQIGAFGGAKLRFANPHALFEYNMPGRMDTKPGLVEMRHELSVLPLAPGISMAKILEDPNVSMSKKLEMSRDFGAAMAAMHLEFDYGDKMPSGGLRTLIHGDFHPPNVFYDSDTRTVTAIDMAGAAGNFNNDPPGFDMLCDVKRALKGGMLALAPQEVRQAFLEGYCADPKIRALGLDPAQILLLIDQKEIGPDGEERHVVPRMVLT